MGSPVALEIGTGNPLLSQVVAALMENPETRAQLDPLLKNARLKSPGLPSPLPSASTSNSSTPVAPVSLTLPPGSIALVPPTCVPSPAAQLSPPPIPRKKKRGGKRRQPTLARVSASSSDPSGDGTRTADDAHTTTSEGDTLEAAIDRLGNAELIELLCGVVERRPSVRHALRRALDGDGR